MMRSLAVAALTLVLSLAGTTTAQNVDNNGCLRLLGSLACPGFQYAYLNPSNLTNAFPFFGGVHDVASFDAGALDYFSDVHEFKTTKFIEQLSCYNASTAVIRWERTVLCSMWVNEHWSLQCLGLYNGTSATTSQKMVCQDTCIQYSDSEKQIVAGAPYCPGPDDSGGNRTYQLNKDFVDCTNWTSLQTNDTSTCVSGAQNEPNCGYGANTAQLCGFCNSTSPDPCCAQSNVDMQICGYNLATNSSGGASSSGGNSGSSTESNHGLSGGQIAGIVVGSVLGGLLLIGLLLFFLFRGRRQRNRDSNGSSFAAASGGGVFGGIFGAQRASNGAPNNSSEKGLLGAQSTAAASSPTMGGDSHMGSGPHGNSSEGAALGAGGLGAAAGAGMAGGNVGERSSGVVLPRVRDENQDGDKWIETGAEVNVLWLYQASLPDELDLRPGMRLRVLRLYDDAWGTAQVVSNTGEEGSEVGKQGAFPIVCVSEGTSTVGSAFSHNASSSVES